MELPPLGRNALQCSQHKRTHDWLKSDRNSGRTPEGSRYRTLLCIEGVGRFLLLLLPQCFLDSCWLCAELPQNHPHRPDRSLFAALGVRLNQGLQVDHVRVSLAHAVRPSQLKWILVIGFDLLDDGLLPLPSPGHIRRMHIRMTHLLGYTHWYYGVHKHACTPQRIIHMHTSSFAHTYT